MMKDKPPNGDVRSLADSRDEMLAALSAPKLRDELRTIVSAIAKCVGAEAREIPVAADALDALAATAVNQRRAPTLDALRMIVESPSTEQIFREWRELMSAVRIQSHRIALGPFAKHCQQRFIAPSLVDDHVLANYEAWLRTNKGVRWPRQTALSVARSWNMQIGAVAGWPAAKIKF